MPKNDEQNGVGEGRRPIKLTTSLTAAHCELDAAATERGIGLARTPAASERAKRACEGNIMYDELYRRTQKP
jgi:hypothetical protein